MALRTGRSLCPAISRCFSTSPAFASTGTEDAGASVWRKRLRGGGIIAAAIGAGIGAHLYLSQQEPESKVRNPCALAIVLVLDSDEFGVAEEQGKSPQHLEISQLIRRQPTWLQLSQVVDALEYAGKDENVRGFVTCIGEGGSRYGLAQTQELRDAILEFRKLKGDRVPTVAYSDSFPDTLAYHLASACDQIYLQPHGSVSFTGLAEETLFAGRLLDRCQVKPHVFAREEYKNVYSQFTHSGYSKAHKEATKAWLQSCMGQIATDVGQSCGLTPRQVRSVIHSFPLSAEEALELGLIDGVKPRLDAMHYLMHYNYSLPAACQQPGASSARQGVSPVQATAPESESAMLAQALVNVPANKGRQSTLRQMATQHWSDDYLHRLRGEEERFDGESVYVTTAEPAAAARHECTYMPLGLYIELLKMERKRDRKESAGAAVDDVVKPGVAVIRVAGEVMSGRGSLIGDSVNSKDICRSLRTAAEAAHVHAVVLRVDSPGGNALASIAIHDEVVRLKATGKPVVASMGNMAASAGYEISAAADKIVAQPGTLTGSIGVVGAKFNFGPMLKQIGIDVESVSVGKHALMDSWFTDVTSQQKRFADSSLNRFYTDFLIRVAAGRNMQYEEVHKIAKGRIWSGAEAHRLGLIDELGGLSRAIALAKQLAGLPKDDKSVDILEWNTSLETTSSTIPVIPRNPLPSVLKVAQLLQGQ